jgi:hypothetical protein
LGDVVIIQISEPNEKLEITLTTTQFDRNFSHISVRIDRLASSPLAPTMAAKTANPANRDVVSLCRRFVVALSFHASLKHLALARRYDGSAS